MNLVLFLLSLLFASYAPSSQTTHDSNNHSTVNEPGPGKGKGNQYNGGDYIICDDILP